MNKKYLGLVFVVVIVTIAGISIAFLTDYIIDLKDSLSITQNELTKSKNDYNTTILNYRELSSKYNSTLLNYDKVIGIKNELQSQKDKLEIELTQSYTTLSQKNDIILQKDIHINEITVELNNLNEQLTQLRLFKIDSSLASFYDYTRTIYGLDGWEVSHSDRGVTEFEAQLAYHDMGYNVWPSIESLYHEDTGETSYVSASNLIDKAISQCNLNPGDSSVVKLKKILDFIQTNVIYKNEIDDVFQAPVETLSFGSGDCEDLSILAAALFEKAGIDSALGDFESTSSTFIHTMVLVHLNELGSNRYLYYDDLTSYGLQSGKWIIIEPQTTINDQYDSEVSQWEVYSAWEVGR